MQEDDRINILYYIPGFNFGGIETVFINTVKACQEKNIDFTLVMENQVESKQVQILRRLGVRVFKICKWSISSTNVVFFQLSEIIEKGQYDIVYCCNITRSILLFIAAKKYGIKNRVFHARTSRFDGTWIKRIIYRILLQLDIYYATHLLANSVESGDFFFGHKPYLVIKNGIDATSFKPKCDKIINRKAQENLTNMFVIGHVGRFTHAKNHKFLIQVFEKIARKKENARLLLVGNGPLFEQIKEMVTQKKLVDKVIFSGAKSDLAEWYCLMDLFVFPSVYEGFGNVVVEAQAAGLPVIASSNVPAAVNVTGTVCFLPLNIGAEKWAETILSKANTEVNYESYHAIELSEYGTAVATGELVSFYQTISRSGR